MMTLVRALLYKLKAYDWFVSVVVFVLLAIGLASIYSVDLSKGDTLIYFPRQLFSACLAVGAYLVAGAIHKTRYESSARFLYLVSIVLLVSVLVFGTEVNGTTGWFRVAGFSFQPVEFAKVALVLLLGWLIHKQGRKFYEWQFVISSGIATAILAGLVILQPDLGSSFILCAVWFSLLFLTGAKKRYLIGLALLFITMITLGWFFFFEDYQRGRFQAFLDPENSPYAYNVRQSMIAIGSGKILGRGLGFGSQSQLNFLPEAQTDFIFAVIGEELGFTGTFTVLLLYFLLFWRLLKLARMARDDFSSYTVLGISSLFFVQMFINIGGASGLIPITGVTLPFISYGGSSLIMNLFLLGISQSVTKDARV